MQRGLWVLVAALAWAMASGAHAETRVALVIGNSAYAAVPKLANPAGDSRLIADALRKDGFNVTLKQDLNYQGLRQALQVFASQASRSDVALIYYAGHGMEIGGQNYLIPVDAKLENERDVDFEAVPLALALNSSKGRALSVVILDACRNNPFAATMQAADGQRSRAVGSRGLARIEPDADTLVVYAAKDGTTASDGEVDSPFAAALAKRMTAPGVEMNLMFRQVRDDVMHATRNSQQPFTYGSLSATPFYFGGGEAQAAAGPAPVQAAPSPPVQVAAAPAPSRPATPCVNRPPGASVDPFAPLAPACPTNRPSSSSSASASAAPNRRPAGAANGAGTEDHHYSTTRFDMDFDGCTLNGSQAECALYVEAKEQKINWPFSNQSALMDNNGGAMRATWEQVGSQSLTINSGYSFAPILPGVRTRILYRFNLTGPAEDVQALAINVFPGGSNIVTFKSLDWR